MSKTYFQSSLVDGDVRAITHLTCEDFASDYTLAILKEAAKLITERFVAENYSKIADKISPEAVANLALAHAAKEIAAKEISETKINIKIRS